ncbi:MAG TPA: hypothetical protein VNW06_02100 [Cytophagaceae bacterium]|jgi:hypothetical protein|nr:hypothetical protein [Cytophagaceae bacterium]
MEDIQYDNETATRPQITPIDTAAVIYTMRKNSIRRKIGRSFFSKKTGWKIRDSLKSFEEYFPDIITE